MISPIDESSGHSNGNGNGYPGKKHRNVTAKQLANLKPPWKKGQSGNTKGGPPGSRGINFWARIRAKLLAQRKGRAGGEIRVDQVVEAFVKSLERGRWPEMKELIDREEGKVPETVNTGGEVVVRVVYGRKLTEADGDRIRAVS